MAVSKVESFMDNDKIFISLKKENSNIWIIKALTKCVKALTKENSNI